MWKAMSTVCVAYVMESHLRNLEVEKLAKEYLEVFAVRCEWSNCTDHEIVLNSEQCQGGTINCNELVAVHLPEFVR